MQFLLENQAAHDARLAALEIGVNKLTEAVSALTDTQQAMQGMMQTMQNEFREGLQSILAVSEQTNAAVRQVAEAEVRTIGRVNVLEDRVDALENSGK
jgi:peptidoglycan hydrolase CwlO-like protein